MPRIIVFYDISDDKKRAKMAHILQALGLIRIQRSVYIGRGGVAKAKEVIRAATRIIDKATDSVAAIIVPDNQSYKLLVAGQLLNTPEKTREKILVV